MRFFNAVISAGLTLLLITICARAAEASDIQNQFLPGIQKIFVNDESGLGTGPGVSCVIVAPPASPSVSNFASCGTNQGLIAIPGNDTKLFNAVMAAKINGNPIWLQADKQSTTTYSCGANVGQTNCALLIFSIQ